MKITTITYTRTLQVRPYESLTFTAAAEVADGESAPLVASALADNVEGWCAAQLEVARVPRPETWKSAAAREDAFPY